MQKTKGNNGNTNNSITVDIGTLQEMLSCGMVTAKKIAEDAGAVICYGKRRLYSVAKIKKYIEGLNA